MQMAKFTGLRVIRTSTIPSSLTADSRVVATTQFEFSFDAWVAPVAALDSAKALTSDGRGDEPTWSPDGRIVHWSYDDGKHLADRVGWKQPKAVNLQYWL